jgi:hypothetical protein
MVLIGATYPTMASPVQSGEKSIAISGFEVKQVTIMLAGTGSVLTSEPVGVGRSIKIGEVTPKLPSALLLFQASLALAVEGPEPLSGATAVPHAAVAGQTGGNAWPTLTAEAVPA